MTHSPTIMVHDRHSQGFTLVELLTTLTVVSVLMGILLPFLNGARRSARAIVCQSNIGIFGPT